MITFLRGELLEVHPTRIVVGVNGIGYELLIPLSSFDRLPGKGKAVTILTHLHVTDDALVLYGFMTEDERGLFRLLLGVSGIGPKAAIGILSGVTPARFRSAISQGSVEVLSTVPGIGKKKAERLIVELRDRIAPPPGGEGEGRPAAEEGVINDAALALVSLGFTEAGARRAISSALERVGKPDDAEKLIREALRSGQ